LNQRPDNAPGTEARRIFRQKGTAMPIYDGETKIMMEGVVHWRIPAGSAEEAEELAWEKYQKKKPEFSDIEDITMTGVEYSNRNPYDVTAEERADKKYHENR